MGKGGFKGMPGGANMQGLMKQAQKMQADLQKAQEEAAQLTAEATAGGGAIRVVASGQQQITEIEIQKDAVDPEDVDMLQDLVLTAVNDALKKVNDAVNERVSKATGGMNIPGLF